MIWRYYLFEGPSVVCGKERRWWCRKGISR